MSGWWGRSCEEEEPEEEEAPPQGKQTIILRLSYSSIQFNSIQLNFIDRKIIILYAQYIETIL